ncbi:hypothetical protein [Mesorhizobium sp.]|nr:hypothetical protein [Mesorhizobium sp.]
MLPGWATKRFSYQAGGGKYSLKDFMTWRTLAAAGRYSTRRKIEAAGT